jgi:hypothetical protein
MNLVHEMGARKQLASKPDGRDSLVSNSVLEKEYKKGKQTRRKHKCLHPIKYIICSLFSVYD